MNEPTRPNAVQDEKPLYRAVFLLRLWCEDQTEGSAWRASLEQPGTGRRAGFASLEQLFMYLMDFTENRIEGPGTESKESS